VLNGATARDIAFDENVSSYQSIRAGELMCRLRRLEPRIEAPVVYWLHGSTGSGKTRFAFEYADENDLELWVSSDNLKWFDGYDNQKAVLFDDFRASHCSFAFLLRLLDRYPMRVPIKGGFVFWNPSIIFITSPYKPKYVYKRFEENVEDLNQLKRRITYTKLFGTKVKPRAPTYVGSNFISAV